MGILLYHGAANGAHCYTRVKKNGDTVIPWCSKWGTLLYQGREKWHIVVPVWRNRVIFLYHVGAKVRPVPVIFPAAVKPAGIKSATVYGGRYLRIATKQMQKIVYCTYGVILTF